MCCIIAVRDSRLPPARLPYSAMCWIWKTKSKTGEYWCWIRKYVVLCAPVQMESIRMSLFTDLCLLKRQKKKTHILNRFENISQLCWINTILNAYKLFIIFYFYFKSHPEWFREIKITSSWEAEEFLLFFFVQPKEVKWNNQWKSGKTFKMAQKLNHWTHANM